MAGLEVVVRPVVLPNLRPAPARALPPQDDPEKGFCIIKGNGGHLVNLSYSHSMSMSKSMPVETERRVDEARVYQMDDDGKVNRDNFVDIEVPNRIKSDGGKMPAVDDSGAGSGTPGVGFEDIPPKLNQPEDLIQYYQPVQEAENIEVKKRNVIKRSGEETQSGPL
jgi:hypothetical protein